MYNEFEQRDYERFELIVCKYRERNPNPKHSDSCSFQSLGLDTDTVRRYWNKYRRECSQMGIPVRRARRIESAIIYFE